MAFITLPLGVKVAVEFDLNGKKVVNIYHVTTADPITSIKLADIATVFVNWATTAVLTALSNEISLTGVTTLDMTQPNGEKSEVVVAPAVAGSGTDPAASNNVALVVSLLTAKTGRSFQGRNYIAGITETDVNQNNSSELFAAGIVIDYLLLKTNLDTDGDTLVVASFQSGGQPRAVGVATPVTNFRVNTRVDTQRRRLPKV